MIHVYDECGKVGERYLWITVPPKRLCTSCMMDQQYQVNLFHKMMKHYGLTKKDVMHVPRFAGIDPSNYN